jgi:hypothetical protein
VDARIKSGQGVIAYAGWEVFAVSVPPLSFGSLKIQGSQFGPRLRERVLPNGRSAAGFGGAAASWHVSVMKNS